MANKNYLERYKITIETLGPLHIGSGHEIGKKDWILNRRDNTAYIIDEIKLFNYLRNNNLLSSFEKFMLSNARGGLFEWAKENKIINDIIYQTSKYSLDCENIAQVNKVRGIQTFIKDGYGKPYIPGSSIKGAIRNVLLSQSIEKDTNSNDDVISALRKPDAGGNKNKLSGEADKLDKKYFRTLNREGSKYDDAVNDVMSGIKISDSKPLSFNNLTLCQKIDAKLDGDPGDGLPIFRECIKPETKIEFNLTIDTALFKKEISYIENAVENFLNNYNEEFLLKFKEEIPYYGNVIYLGGGAGYHTKTVTSSLLKNEVDKVKIIGNIINNTVSNDKRDEHRHYDDHKLGVSPHIVKLTEYDGELVQMGPCRIKISKL